MPKHSPEAHQDGQDVPAGYSVPQHSQSSDSGKSKSSQANGQAGSDAGYSVPQESQMVVVAKGSDMNLTPFLPEIEGVDFDRKARESTNNHAGSSSEPMRSGC